MPSIFEYAAVGPVAPLLPQLPQVSHGDSSMRSITVLLAVVPGVGEGEGAGLGAGKALVVVEDEVDFPPQATRANVIASIRKQQ
jgi:hypothetical protein